MSGALRWLAVMIACSPMVSLRADESASLVAPGGKPEKLATGFSFTEGPTPDKKGDIYFSDIPNAKILRWSTDGKLSVFTDKSGSSNGLKFDTDGKLLACQHGNRRVAAFAPDGTESVVVDAFEGKKLNSPNDLWIDAKGGVYFTDPRYGKSDNLEQNGEHVYYLKPDRKTTVRVVSDMVRPNGIIGSKDGKLLYITDHGGKKTYRYAIESDGSLSNKALFCEEGSDGMKLDQRGNLYLTNTAVQVFDPSGKKIETITIPETPANLCFGGPDGKTLFVTARTSLYAVPMIVAGQDY